LPALPDFAVSPPPAVSLSLAGPPAPGRRARRLRATAAILTAWTAYGLVHAAYWISTTAAPDPWYRLLGIALVMAWLWAALTPLLFSVARFADPARIGWPRSLATHGAALVAVALLMGSVRLVLILATAEGASAVWFAFEPRLLWPRVVFWADVNFFTYVAVILTGRAMASHRRYLDRTLRTHVLETQLARAQLHFLELQLQPHFLFNSLNVIQELAHEAPNAAERMLRRLQALLARSLERSGQDEHTMAEELAALEPYLDIQRTRFEWLAVGIHVSADTRAAMVPHLILQPLVENAIRHGLAVRKAPGHIEVFAERRGDRLVMEVRDDGVGLQAASLTARHGIGLRNASERLRQLYGKDHRFELRPREHGGVVVEIDIPFHQRAEGVPTPSWTESPRTRETMPEVPVEEVSTWRTGEFAAALAPTPSPIPLGPTDRLRRLPPRDMEREHRESEPLIAAVEREHEPSAPLFTARTWFILVGIWLSTATLWAIQMHGFIWLSDGLGTGWDWMIVRLQFAGAMYWTAASLGIFALARRFRLYGSHTARNLAVHLGAAVAISFGFLWVLQSLGLSTAPILNEFNINPLTGNFFLYFGLLAWSHSRDFAAWYRARELASARLTSEIARSRFQALCVQVRPQFVLGTLDLLARLVHMDVPRADRLIARLADVLRLTLDTASQDTTTLAEEMHLVAASVEAHRLGIRPGVALEADVPSETLSTPIPSRLLTTLVDDLLATDHEGSTHPLRIEVTAERALDATRIRVHGATTGAADAGPHEWWRRKSSAEAAVVDAGPLVTVAFPDRATAILIVADHPQAPHTAVAAA
jgi:LytS/YehU family sensor histidine kinase